MYLIAGFPILLQQVFQRLCQCVGLALPFPRDIHGQAFVFQHQDLRRIVTFIDEMQDRTEQDYQQYIQCDKAQSKQQDHPPPTEPGPGPIVQ